MVRTNQVVVPLSIKGVHGISRHQSASVHGVAQAALPEIVSRSYRVDKTVPLANTGGRAAEGYPPLHVECSSTGFGEQGSSLVVPTTTSF